MEFSKKTSKNKAVFQEFQDCARLRQELVFLRGELVFLREIARDCAGVRLSFLVFWCFWSEKHKFPTISNRFCMLAWKAAVDIGN